MRKHLKILVIALAMFFLSVQVSAITISEAYNQIKSENSDLIERMYKGGASDEDILNFLNDVRDYIADKGDAVTKENFDQVITEAVTKVVFYTRNLPIHTALTKEFSNEAFYFVLNGKVPESLEPIYAAIRKVVLSNPQLFENGSQGGNKGNTGNTGSTGGGQGAIVAEPQPSPAIPTETKEPVEIVAGFIDCGHVSWAAEAIENLVASGVISGYGDSTFRPDNNITRAEFAKIAVLAFDLYNESASGDFVDVDENEWYFSYVGSAQSKELIMGSPAHSGSYRFSPTDLITREDLAVIIYRALQQANISLPKTMEPIEFFDKDMISDYALEAVNAMQTAGVISGMGDGQFAPRAYATRAQAAKMIYSSIKVF